jgi:PRC-barrel domain
MATTVDSRRETVSLIGSDKVEGTAVYGADDRKIGSVQRVMIDKISGKVAYAVVSFGGFLGTPKGQAHSKLSPAIVETEVARLTRELSEERKQRKATSEVLHLLSGSHGHVNRLFDTILTNATKLCQATFGALFLCEADAFRLMAQHNAPRLCRASPTRTVGRAERPPSPHQ